MCVRIDGPEVQKGEADFGFSFFIGSPPMMCYSIRLIDVRSIQTIIRYRNRYNCEIELETPKRKD